MRRLCQNDVVFRAIKLSMILRSLVCWTGQEKSGKNKQMVKPVAKNN